MVTAASYSSAKGGAFARRNSRTSTRDAVHGDGDQGLTSPWSVTCAFPVGVLEGQIDFLTNQRLSDYLRVPQHFILVREAKWEPLLADDTRPTAARRDFRIAVVQVAELVGITEAETQRGRGHPGRLQAGSELEVG